MYSETLTQAHAIGLSSQIPKALRSALNSVLNQWQLLLEGSKRDSQNTPWQLLSEVPESWLRSLQNFNSAVGEYINERPGEAHGPFLNFYFRFFIESTVNFHSLQQNPVLQID